MNAPVVIPQSDFTAASALYLYFAGKKRNVKVSGDWIGSTFKLNIGDFEFFTFAKARLHLINCYEQMPQLEVLQ